MIDRINSGKNKFETLESFVCELSEKNKLNLIISDGKNLFVHKNMEKTLYYLHTENGYFFATVPLDNGDWKELSTNQLIAFCDGEIIFSGKNIKIYSPL